MYISSVRIDLSMLNHKTVKNELLIKKMSFPPKKIIKKIIS